MTASPPPLPSWKMPIAVGAAVTLLLHGLVLWDHALWIPVLGSCGCTASPIGLLPAILALRRDPRMTPGSGFAIAFIAVGIGALVLAIVTVLQGFQLSPEAEEAIRASMKESERTDEDISQLLGVLRDSGGVPPVVAAAMLALGGGISGAALVAIAGRRKDRSPPSRPDAPWPAP